MVLGPLGSHALFTLQISTMNPCYPLHNYMTGLNHTDTIGQWPVTGSVNYYQWVTLMVVGLDIGTHWQSHCKGANTIID
jgi:hypothetical protein